MNFSTFLVEVSHFLLIYHFAKAIGILSNFSKGSNKRKHSIILNCSTYYEVVFLDHQSTVLFTFRNSCVSVAFTETHTKKMLALTFLSIYFAT